MGVYYKDQKKELESIPLKKLSERDEIILFDRKLLQRKPQHHSKTKKTLTDRCLRSVLQFVSEIKT